MESTKNKAASPGRGETAQGTTDSNLHHTPFALLGKINWLDVAVYLCFVATGALLGSLS